MTLKIGLKKGLEAILIATAGLTGCNTFHTNYSQRATCQRTEYIPENERLTQKYFLESYHKLNTNESSQENNNRNQSCFKELSPETRNFIYSNFPYIHLSNPSAKDLEFFYKYIDEIETYRVYKEIDIQNLTSDQKDWLKDFEKEYGKQGKYLSKQNIKFISRYPWIRPQNLTLRDKLFLEKVDSVFSAASCIP